MASVRSFPVLFETLGRPTAPHATSVNRAALARLGSLLDAPLEAPGRGVLLLSPHAGYGKTHLLGRLARRFTGSHEFIPLRVSRDTGLDATSVLLDTLRGLTRLFPSGGGLSSLDLLARRLFASALQPLVHSGEVPCQDQAAALAALRDRPIESFDFHDPRSATAQWAREHFDTLAPRLALTLSQRVSAFPGDVRFWIEALFQFASSSSAQPTRADELIGRALTGPAAQAQASGRLDALLALLTRLIRVVLVADELDGLVHDEEAALRVAAFFGGLRASAERVDVVVSVNRAVWESAFAPKLPGGLLDRLGEEMIELGPLDAGAAAALLGIRLPAVADRVAAMMPADGIASARGVLRFARDLDLPEESAPLERDSGSPAGSEDDPGPGTTAFVVEEESVVATASGTDGEGERGVLPQVPAGASDKDRVEELLRRFRERYARG